MTARGGAIAGSFEVWVNGTRERTGTFASGTRIGERDVVLDPNRKACVLSPAQATSGGNTIPGSWLPGAPGTPGTTFRRQASFVPTTATGWTDEANTSFARIAEWSYRVDRWEKTSLQAGLDLTIVVYSDLPNDYANVVFEVLQEPLVPNDESDYRTELWNEKLDGDAKAQAALQAAQARRERDAYCQRTMDEGCIAEGWRYGQPTTAYATPNAATPSAPTPRATTPPRVPEPRSTPNGPPPPAPPEVQPAKPTPHATWIGGYYAWNGFVWQWVEGAFRIPPEDLRPPPGPPPPPPQQSRPTPPPPRAGAQWAAGHWEFTLNGWVWLAGRWQ